MVCGVLPRVQRERLCVNEIMRKSGERVAFLEEVLEGRTK
jgi:hypothetical protein